jgi:murein L,D-transpeptidase YcbB/YkuD
METRCLRGIGRHIVALSCIVLAASCSRVEREQFAPEVQRLVQAPPQWVDRGSFGKRIWAIQKQFYEAREYAPAWIDGDRPTEQLDQLVDVIGEADAHGLDPQEYGIQQLRDARAAAEEAWIGARFAHERIPEIDLRLTYAFLEHAADLLGWRLSPRAVDPSWLAAPKKVDLVDRLEAALDGNKIGETLETLAPEHPQYKGLQAALARAREEGKRDDVQRIVLNLERWRWVPSDLGERHVLVNVPSYQMQVIEGGTPVLAMRVIVGAPETPTPLFSDKMTYVVFSPYWNIPESILREETLPRLVEDPEYLVRNNMEVVGTSGELVDVTSVDWTDEEVIKGLRFRQAPGPENALGLVKFIFPNHFSVYLHDTPGDALFNKEQRTLSHGCIRIEKPVELAQYVLGDRGWTEPRIAKAMHAQEEHSVKLTEPLPVHIGYWTAWVQEDGRVAFTDDPYGLDAKHAAARGK